MLGHALLGAVSGVSAAASGWVFLDASLVACLGLYVLAGSVTTLASAAFAMRRRPSRRSERSGRTPGRMRAEPSRVIALRYPPGR